MNHHAYFLDTVRLHIYLLIYFLSGGGMSKTQFLWGGQRIVWGKLVLFFHYVGPILDIHHFYPLNHRTGPSFDLTGLPKNSSLSWCVCQGSHRGPAGLLINWNLLLKSVRDPRCALGGCNSTRQLVDSWLPNKCFLALRVRQGKLQLQT